MHSLTLLHKNFEEQLPNVHKVRLKSLMTVCQSALMDSRLFMTSLGRGITNNNKESSNIQKVDRLLGNGRLQAERDSFYQVLISHVIQEDQKNPWIHVDWLCINATTNLYVIRASLSMKGRSIVIYEECHPKKNENNHRVHKVFLNKLKTLLPSSITPVIVTDAGFRGPWFAHVLKLNWHFVGRLRNKNLVQLENESDWALSSSYFEQATRIPKYLGQGLLTQEGKIPVHLVLYKGKPKGRQQINKNKKKSSSGKSKVYSKANKEPWVLVSSISLAKEKPVLITNIYRQRMRIEQNIKDTKCPHYGLGLKKSLTRDAQRVNILLLIAAIATLAAWLAGLITKFRNCASDFQVHSAKFTSVLSIVFLGRRAIKKGLNITPEENELAFSLLYEVVLKAQQEKPHYV
jgi:Transposase DDE domain